MTVEQSAGGGDTGTALTLNGGGDPAGKPSDHGAEGPRAAALDASGAVDAGVGFGGSLDAPDSGGHAVPPQLAQPIAREDGHYVLEFDSLFFEVDPGSGARVITARVGQSANILTGPADDPANYGSTFRTSPQSAWNPAGWPPPPELDVDPYAASVSADGFVAVGSPSAAVGVAVTKEFRADLANAAVVAAYTTLGTAANTMLAPWEVTRVAPGGLTFYPTGDLAPSSGNFALPATQPALGCTWFEYPDSVTASQRLIADGKEGWIAHVTADRQLLVKKYPDIPADAHAPDEGEISIYVDGGGRFVELEEQGAYSALGAGESTTWSVTWYLRQLPEGMNVSVGNPALLEYVRSVIE